MNKWEYIRVQSKVDEIKTIDETVDQLGREGWELVCAISTTTYLHMWFKRPVR